MSSLDGGIASILSKRQPPLVITGKLTQTLVGLLVVAIENGSVGKAGTRQKIYK